MGEKERKVRDRLGNQHQTIPVASDARLENQTLPWPEGEVFRRELLSSTIADPLLQRFHFAADLNNPRHQLVPENDRRVRIYIGMTVVIDRLVGAAAGTHRDPDHKITRSAFHRDDITLDGAGLAQVSKGS